MRTLWNQIKTTWKPEYIGWALVVIGSVVRIRQYAANRSLWHDEANLALNLVSRSFSGLFQPLDFDQGAPIGFLLIEKLVMLLFGSQDYFLRIVPLLSGIIAVYLFYRLATEYFGSVGYFALLVFAVSWPLVYYSSELKQYSSDVMITVLLLYLALGCLGDKARPRDLLQLGVAGSLAIWVSHPAAFVIAGIGLVLALEKLIQRAFKHLFWTSCIGAIWMLSFGVTYLVSLQDLVVDKSLNKYWQYAFIPIPPWENWDWFSKTYLSLLENTVSGFGYWYPALLCATLMMFGILSLLIRNRYLAFFFIMPALMVSLASAMRIYPLRGRLTLFLAPFIILLLAEGLGRIHSLLRRWNPIFAYGLSVAVGLSLLWTPVTGVIGNFFHPPMGAHIKPVMSYVRDHRLQDDVVYVYHGARPAFNYYAPFYHLETGNVISGGDLPGALALNQFYKQVNKLQGYHRVWIIFSHVIDCGGCEGNMEFFYIQHLNQFGTIEDHFKAPGASVYLYDFGYP